MCVEHSSPLFLVGMRCAPAVRRVCYPVTERWPVKWLEEEVGKHGVSV